MILDSQGHYSDPKMAFLMFFQPNNRIRLIIRFTMPLKLFYIARHCGGVAEWLKAAVLKTADGQPSESSNLSSSAIKFNGLA